MLEDVPTDAALIERELKKAQISYVARRVETRETFLKGIEEFLPDIILSDYSLPIFDGMAALSLANGYLTKTCVEVFSLYSSSASAKAVCVAQLQCTGFKSR